MKIPKIKFQKTKNFLIKLPRTLGSHTLLTFLFLFVFALVLGGIIFERYSILAQKEAPEVSEKPLQFKEKTYQNILEVWQEKKQKLIEIDLKKYPDPFRGIKGEVPKPIPEIPPEIPEEEPPETPTQEIDRLLAATNLTEFYSIKGEKLPPLYVRAGLWQEKGLGLAYEYIGSRYQNLKLLEALQKELTP
ncbi:hypothetical protein AMJ50_00695 [Parcubacteria bacterium DG_74_3]|nr:MAG: hypothetical protein AMJ50_00695 [Parcubacteria bacterium DG_74_3]